VHTQQEQSLFGQAKVLETPIRTRSTRFIILDKMLWPFTTSAHTRYMPFLAPISLLWRRRRHTFSCQFLNENHELSRNHRAKLICVVRECTRLTLIYSRAGFGQRLLAWLTSEPTYYMHQLLLPKLVKVTLGGIFVLEFCYTSGNHGSIWANFCSPSKTTKLVQISNWTARKSV